MVSRKANSSSGRSGSGRPFGTEAGREEGAARRRGKAKRPARPLDQTALHDLALAYVARFATTGAKLENYLRRKLRERGTAEEAEGEPGIDIPALIARMIALGYVDDDAYARMRARGLSARGFGARRIDQALHAAGVGEQIRAGHAPGEAERRRAAAQLARRRRFGPYVPDAGDPSPAGPDRQKAREKAVAAMLRAGHEFAHARFILEAADTDQVEQWVAEAQDDGRADTGDEGLWYE